MQRLFEEIEAKKPKGTLNQSIDFNKIVSEQKISISSKKYKTMQFACECANEVRSEIIFSSSTHPDAKLYDQEAFQKLKLQINGMRENGKKDVKEMLGEKFDLSDKKIQEKWIQIKTDNIQLHGCGNCEESAIMTYRIAREKQKNYPVKICKLAKDRGDHVFLVFDPDENNPKKSYGNFGENAIVCDPLLGLVFSASDIPKYLKAYQLDELTQTKAFVDFDPAKHKIESFFPEVPGKVCEAEIPSFQAKNDPEFSDKSSVSRCVVC